MWNINNALNCLLYTHTHAHTQKHGSSCNVCSIKVVLILKVLLLPFAPFFLSQRQEAPEGLAHRALTAWHFALHGWKVTEPGITWPGAELWQWPQALGRGASVSVQVANIALLGQWFSHDNRMMTCACWALPLHKQHFPEIKRALAQSAGTKAGLGTGSFNVGVPLRHQNMQILPAVLIPAWFSCLWLCLDAKSPPSLLYHSPPQVDRKEKRLLDWDNVR